MGSARYNQGKPKVLYSLLQQGAKMPAVSSIRLPMRVWLTLHTKPCPQEVLHESLNFFYVNIGLSALGLSFIPE